MLDSEIKTQISHKMKNYKILRPAQLAEMLGICTVTLWRWSKEPHFPRKIQIGKRAVGWRSDEIEKYLDKQTEVLAE